MVVKWCRFARVRLPNFNTLVIYNENKKTIMLQQSRKKPIVLTFLCHRIYTLNEYYTTYFVCSLEPLSFTRRALFKQHPNEWLTYEITWNYNSVSKYLHPMLWSPSDPISLYFPSFSDLETVVQYLNYQTSRWRIIKLNLILGSCR